MSKVASQSPAELLSHRLRAFRKWLVDEAHAKVHPSVCIVNGDATDGTKNAPVLEVRAGANANAADHDVKTSRDTAKSNADDATDALYKHTMGCQVRSTKEIKADEVILEMPRSAMITPDVVAASDAGRAVVACIVAAASPQNDVPDEGSTKSRTFWDGLTNTTMAEQEHLARHQGHSGPQLLVKLLQVRKRAQAMSDKFNNNGDDNVSFSAQQLPLVGAGIISTRAPLLAFLVHQRFAGRDNCNNRIGIAAVQSGTVDFGSCINGTAMNGIKPVHRLHGSPESFAAYADMVPSIISLPLCWTRTELGLLAACVSGHQLLQEVLAATLQLEEEFVALLNAGIVQKFPTVFAPGVLTWHHWLWAASCVSSRTLPATCYFNAGDKDAHDFVHHAGENEMQSPPDIWNELGVMIPLLDMLNHEVEANQVTWQPCVPDETHSDDDSSAGKQQHPPRAVLHKKVRKGSEIFTCYGNLSNQNMILQYGFALINNAADVVRMGWALADAVGNVDPPRDYESANTLPNGHVSVFESSDANEFANWWTPDRVKLLKKEAFASADDSFMTTLLSGGKSITAAYNDKSYNPILLTAAVVATMPPSELVRHSKVRDNGAKFMLSSQHQAALRDYLVFTFTRKLEKLLQILSTGLQSHLPGPQLWTKASCGGLKYEGDNGKYIGWQRLFDMYAYKSAMEVERSFYALGVESCALTFYDGQLRALQTSIDGVREDKLYKELVEQQLEELGFLLLHEPVKPSVNDGSGPSLTTDESTSVSNNGHNHSGSSLPKAKKKRRRRSSGDGPAHSEEPSPLKLHVGNLAYSTTPAELYEYFSNMYGKSKVLECHIPVERATGRSRGFGFVTFPYEVAMTAMLPESKHEYDGRLLKVSRSNSGGNSGSPNTALIASNRCLNCGYSPRYCHCPVPNIPGSAPAGEEYRRSRSARDEHYDRRRECYDDDRRYGYRSRSPREWSREGRHTSRDGSYDRREYRYDFGRRYEDHRYHDRDCRPDGEHDGRRSSRSYHDPDAEYGRDGRHRRNSSRDDRNRESASGRRSSRSRSLSRRRERRGRRENSAGGHDLSAKEDGEESTSHPQREDKNRDRHHRRHRRSRTGSRDWKRDRRSERDGVTDGGEPMDRNK